MIAITSGKAGGYGYFDGGSRRPGSTFSKDIALKIVTMLEGVQTEEEWLRWLR